MTSSRFESGDTLHCASLLVDDRNMSRREFWLISIAALVICAEFATPVLWGEGLDADRASVLQAIAWEDQQIQLSDPSRVVTISAQEATSPVENDADEFVLPDDPFDGQPQQMFYSSSRQERLIDRIVDPTAWLMNYRFRESWNWPVNNSGRDSEEFQFRPTIPFRAWDHVNILRVTVPYTVSGPGGPGLGDVEVFDLVVHEEEWGRWGVGPDFRLTSGGSGSFQLGPVAGAVTKDRYWTIGVLTQNFFADDVAETRIQPILAYKFDEQWAVGVGEFEFRYDWEDMDWTQVPLGVEVNYITDVYRQKIHFFVNPQYNFERDASNSGWTLFLGMSLLVPGA
jgi:hypothetical protein